MSRDVARNKKARRDYSISEVLEAGIQLRGTEVKAIREGKVNISDAFVRIERKKAFLYGCDIQPWQAAGEYFQHAPKRPRRLLLHKNEILKLAQSTDEKGYTLPCLRLYFKGSRVKVEFGLGKGKSHTDQRHDLKKRAEMREAEREVARFNRR